MPEERCQRCILGAGYVGYWACSDDKLGYWTDVQHWGGGFAKCYWGRCCGAEGTEIGRLVEKEEKRVEGTFQSSQTLRMESMRFFIYTVRITGLRGRRPERRSQNFENCIAIKHILQPDLIKWLILFGGTLPSLSDEVTIIHNISSRFLRSAIWVTICLMILPVIRNRVLHQVKALTAASSFVAARSRLFRLLR